MPEAEALLGRTVVLVAHPDDEAAGCGVLLQRMREPIVLFATDGAPRDDYFWRQFGSRRAYAETRRIEARDALAVVGVRQFEFLTVPHTGDACVDQELYLAIPDALRALESVLDRIRPEALLTLAYEGGHPDHDTCNFLCSVLGRRHGLPVFEMALYHRSEDGLSVHQNFRWSSEDEIVVQPTPQELERKHRMLATYVSQHLSLEFFTSDVERFRPLVAYDYSRPPHPGTLNYEAWQWPMTGSDLVRAFAPYLTSDHATLRHSSNEGLA
jgi:LmbE family N-acetylglucosaminyl deacetylase